MLEAMASGTPVVTVPEPALLEVVGDAAVVVAARTTSRTGSGGRSRSATGSSTPGSSARAPSRGRRCAAKTIAVYREALGR